MDLIIGQAVGDALQNGKKVSIKGAITREGDPNYRDNIDFRMEVDKENQQILSGGFYSPNDCWFKPGTHIRERGSVDPADMSYNVNGYVGAGFEGNEPDNESLKITPGLGEISMGGKLDDYIIDQKVSIDPFAGSVNHEGNIAGRTFKRSISPVSLTESVIEGNFDALRETGKITLEADGGLVITRDIGPYHIYEKVTFEAPPGKS